MNRRVRIVVRGIVQGVGFRFFAKLTAARLSLTGFVRNKPDGSVEAEAEGDKEAVDLFIEEISRGPSSGRVTQIDVEDLPTGGNRTGFDIDF